MIRVLVVNGPNLNLLGMREPEIYGSTTLAEIDEKLVRRGEELGLSVRTFQSNHEGVLIDRLQERDFDWAIVNAGGLTHTSVSLRDCLLGIGRPFVEVHLSDPAQREAFRHVNYLHDIAVERFVGHGASSYTMALDFIARRAGTIHDEAARPGAARRSARAETSETPAVDEAFEPVDLSERASSEAAERMDPSNPDAGNPWDSRP